VRREVLALNGEDELARVCIYFVSLPFSKGHWLVFSSCVPVDSFKIGFHLVGGRNRLFLVRFSFLFITFVVYLCIN
jgi:hypothetical protein